MFAIATNEVAANSVPMVSRSFDTRDVNAGASDARSDSVTFLTPNKPSSPWKDVATAIEPVYVEHGERRMACAGEEMVVVVPGLPQRGVVMVDLEVLRCFQQDTGTSNKAPAREREKIWI